MLPAALRPRVAARPRAIPTLAISAPAALFVALALGAVVRLRPVLFSDFPVNDGGMFYTIVRDIERSGFGWPDHLSYNGLGLPFAYAPLSFYLAAAVNALGVELLDVFRLLPALLAFGVLVAFVRFARAVLHDDRLVALAAFGFALVPNAYASHVTGGGLPRALGVLFLLVALERLIVLFETRSAAALAGASIASALTALSHTEMGWALAFSAVVLWLFRYRSRRALRDGILAAGGAAVLVAPWLGAALARYGVTPFLAAFGTGTLDNPAVRLLIFDQSGEPWFPLFAGLALLGVVRAIGRREWWLPAWIVAIAFLDSRSLHVLTAIPMAILAAQAVGDVVAPLVRAPRLRAGLALFAIAYALVTTTQAVPDLLRTIPVADRAAMAWARDNSPAGARFLVVTERGWAENSVGEWFPALAERPSVTTVQGWEWMPGGAFWTQLRRFFAAQACGSQDTACLDGARARWSFAYEYVYLPSEKLRQRPDWTDEPCCASLRGALDHDPRYELVYASGGAFIFRLR